MPEPTTPAETEEKKEAPPTKEELHKIRVRHKDVELPYDELVRRAQLGTTAEALQAEKDALKQSKTDYDAVTTFLEKARANPAAAPVLNDLYEAVLNDQPIPAKYTGAQNGDPSETDVERGDPPPQAGPTPQQIRIEQELNEIKRRLAQEDLTRATSARQTAIQALIDKDDALRGSDLAAETADALAAGFMASDKELSPDDAIVLAVDHIRKTATSIVEKKHHTRRDLRQSFPNSPGEQGSPSLSTGEANTFKDLEDGTVKKRALAAMDKLFLRGS